MPACLSGHIFQKTICPNQTSRKFLYLLLVVVTRSSSDDRYVLPVPVLQMTSCFHIIKHMWVYGEAYGRRMSAGGTQRWAELQLYSFAHLCVTSLWLTSSAISLAAHNGVWLCRCGGKQCVAHGGRSLPSSITLFYSARPLFICFHCLCTLIIFFCRPLPASIWTRDLSLQFSVLPLSYPTPNSNKK